MSDLSAEKVREKYRRIAAASKSYTWFNYQPINLPGFEETLTLAGRNCFDRCQALMQAIQERFGSRSLRIIDWGCNLGFFVFELAKQGHQVVGVDCNQEYVEVCRCLAGSYPFPHRPLFYSDKLTATSLSNYPDFDIALCFSVFHHQGKELTPLLCKFSEVYPSAFVEMDGPKYGQHQLFSFYHSLKEVVETNDPYGKGTRRRKTWFCDNRVDQALYSNLKDRNLLGGRAVFKKQTPQAITVLKKEEQGSSHTWLRTNLAVEIENYRAWGGTEFFPALIDSGEDKTQRWLELEYVPNDSPPATSAIDRFFAFLESQKLFILDMGADSFLFHQGKLKVVDLESLFTVKTSLADLFAEVARKSSILLDTYEKQRNYIISRVAQ